MVGSKARFESFANSVHYNTVIHEVVFKICVNTSKKEYEKNFLVCPWVVRPRARGPTCPLAAPLSLLLSDDVCRRCNLACDQLFTFVVKFLRAPFWRPCILAPGGICTPLPPLRYASGSNVWCVNENVIEIHFG